MGTGRSTSPHSSPETASSGQDVDQEAKGSYEKEQEVNRGIMIEQVDEGCNEAIDGSGGHPVAVPSRPEVTQDTN